MYLIADLHGEIEKLIDLIDTVESKNGDEIVVLGDAGVNYYLDERDRKLKKRIQEAISFYEGKRINVLFVRGNHDFRPEKISTYKSTIKYSGECYYEEEFPNLLFLKDGETYEINKTPFLVLGGGFSSDFFNRLLNGYGIWTDQEINKDEYELAIRNMESLSNFNVLSHMLPLNIVERIGINIEYVSETEKMFDQIMIENGSRISSWYAGHYHKDIQIENGNTLFGIIYKNPLYI